MGEQARKKRVKGRSAVNRFESVQTSDDTGDLLMHLFLIVWYHDHANKKVAAFLGQRLKLSKSTVFFVPKTMGIGGFFKNFGKCPKMAHFGQNLA